MKAICDQISSAGEGPVVYQARAALLCDQPYPLIRVGQSSRLANSTTTSSTS